MFTLSENFSYFVLNTWYTYEIWGSDGRDCKTAVIVLRQLIENYSNTAILFWSRQGQWT
jgi:hypothetical protein